MSVGNKADNITHCTKESSKKENIAKSELKSSEISTKKNGILDCDDPLLEIIELTGGNSGEKKDSKRGKKLYCDYYIT